MENNFKSGFVNIIGVPNVGKSTLINALVGEKISIITPKIQTTRHRIMGILNGPGYQIVFSDTPGILQPKYKLHEAMMRFVETALEDADVLLYMVEFGQRAEVTDIVQKIKRLDAPVLLVINKVDLASQEDVVKKIDEWKQFFDEDMIIPVSAMHNFNLEALMNKVVDLLPQGQPFYSEDVYTDKTERFITAEIIREKIFMLYQKEVPYSSEVQVLQFKEAPDIIHISAEIIVDRKSQKPILIGKGGEMLKRVGTQARKDIEAAFDKKVFLELYVKVREKWREKPTFLRSFGYEH